MQEDKILLKEKSQAHLNQMELVWMERSSPSSPHMWRFVHLSTLFASKLMILYVLLTNQQHEKHRSVFYHKSSSTRRDFFHLVKNISES